MKRLHTAYLPAVCLAMAVGSGVAGPSVADASTLSCSSSAGDKMTVVDGRTACATESDQTGRSVGYGIDGGVGYAKGVRGASAFGIGVDGGVGASEGIGGIPAAMSLGARSVAITSVADGSISVALAGPDSQALVANSVQGVLCQGSSAFAWNTKSGAICLSTALGAWPGH